MNSYAYIGLTKQANHNHHGFTRSTIGELEDRKRTMNHWRTVYTTAVTVGRFIRMSSLVRLS